MLASLVSACLLLIALGVITWEAVGRLQEPAAVGSTQIIVVAAIGVVLGGIVIGATGWGWVDPVLSLLIVVVILIGTWGLSTTEVALTAHLVTPSGYPGTEVVQELAGGLRDRFGVDHATLQIEVDDPGHGCALER